MTYVEGLRAGIALATVRLTLASKAGCISAKNAHTEGWEPARLIIPIQRIRSTV